MLRTEPTQPRSGAAESARSPSGPLLALEQLDVLYGESHVLHEVSWALAPGRLLALLGRNGAGKSTTLHAVVGFQPVRAGRVRLAGQDLTGAAPETISRAGIALVPQGRRVFGSLTVRENLDVAARRDARAGERRWTRDDVTRIFPRLAERAHQPAASLSGGEQQMLAIGRALMTNPRVLLLDEPSEGLAPRIVEEVRDVLQRLKQELSIVLVEQNLRLAMGLADDVVLLDTGRVVFAGTRDALAAQPERLDQHLGVAAA